MTLVRSELPRVVVGVLLIAAWCALWGEITAANILSGVLVAGVAMIGTRPARFSVRPMLLLRFALLVVVDIVRSTLTVAWEVVTPQNRTNEAIIAVPLTTEARHHYLLLAMAITVTPGTAVVEIDEDDCIFYLHMLHSDQRVQVIDHVQRLARLAAAALPPRSTETVDP